MASKSQCHACWQSDPSRLEVWLDSLGRRVALPDWFDEFVGYVSVRYGVHRSLDILRDVAAEIGPGSASPRAVLERCRPGRSRGSAVLEAFLVATRRGFDVDDGEARAMRRRQARIDATPQRWRPDVDAFSCARVAARERSERRGTRQVSHRYIEQGLAVLRDFACFADVRVDGWASVSTSDIEAFLSPVAATRTEQLDALRLFFQWSRRSRRVVSDPTAPIRSQRRFGYQPTGICDDALRMLFRRWTSDDADVFEATIGMLTLMHGASLNELRHLTTADIDTATRSMRLGRRPARTVLDPFTWTVIERALRHHRDVVGELNPHVFTTARTRMRPGPPPSNRISDYLTIGQLGVNARMLRSIHLARMATELDVVTASAAHALTHKAILYYVDDGLDSARGRLATPRT